MATIARLSTIARTGRRMKMSVMDRRASLIAGSLPLRGVGRGRGLRGGERGAGGARHEGLVAQLERARGRDLLALGEALEDDDLLADGRAELHVALAGAQRVRRLARDDDEHVVGVRRAPHGGG